MKTVFLVFEGRNEDRDVVAVHTTLEGARYEHRREHPPEWRETADGYRCWHFRPDPKLPIQGGRYCDFSIRQEALYGKTKVKNRPTARDLLGLAKGMTGGLPSEVWVRMIRDEAEDSGEVQDILDRTVLDSERGHFTPSDLTPCDCGVDDYFAMPNHMQGHADTCPKHGQQEDS